MTSDGRETIFEVHSSRFQSRRGLIHWGDYTHKFLAHDPSPLAVLLGVCLRSHRYKSSLQPLQMDLPQKIVLQALANNVEEHA